MLSTKGSRRHNEQVPVRPTKERIIETSIDLIADEGYSSLTFGTIAKNLGVSKGLVSYHFSSKEALVTAILGCIGYGYGGYVSEMVQAADSNQKLTRLITAIFHYALEHSKELKTLMEIGDKAPRNLVSDAKSSNEIILERIEEYASADSRYSHYSSTEIQRIALILKGGMDAYITAWHNNTVKKPRSPRYAATTLLDHII